MAPESLAQVLQTALYAPPAFSNAPNTSSEAVCATAVEKFDTPNVLDAERAAKWLTHVREDQLPEEMLEFSPGASSLETSYTLDGLIAIAQVVVYENDVVCQRILRSSKQNCLYTAAALHALLRLCLKAYV